MRIGIDTTPLPQRPVGAGVYILRLVQALHKLDVPCEFVILAQVSGARLLNLAPKDNFRLVVLPDKSPAVRLAWEQTVLPRMARQLHLDVLHSLHYTRPVMLSCRSVVTLHDMTFFLFPKLHTFFKRLYFPPMIRFSARHADLLAAVSENTRQDSIRLLGIPPEKIFTTPLGVEEDFRPVHDDQLLKQVRENYHLPEKFILNVGVVEPRKNLSLLIRAYHRLLKAGLQIHLVIVGRLGWMYQDVFRVIESLGLKDQVIFTGYVPREDLPVIYNLAELFVYPSQYEGFGLPPLEAMACGVPVVTTRVSSMPEHVGNAGILVPPGDEDALVQAVQALLADTNMRQHLREEGPRQAAFFNWSRTAAETVKIYDRLLSS